MNLKELSAGHGVLTAVQTGQGRDIVLLHSLLAEQPSPFADTPDRMSIGFVLAYGGSESPAGSSGAGRCHSSYLAAPDIHDILGLPAEPSPAI